MSDFGANPTTSNTARTVPEEEAWVTPASHECRTAPKTVASGRPDEEYPSRRKRMQIIGRRQADLRNQSKETIVTCAAPHKQKERVLAPHFN